MELHGHFRYGGKNSSDYRIILAHIETEHDFHISGAIETVGMFSKRGIKKYFTRDDYSESSISFDVEFVVDDDICLSLVEQRMIEKWLFYSQGFMPLYLDRRDDYDGENIETINGNDVELYLNCRFTHPEKIEGNGGIVGFRAVLEADSPFAWQDGVYASFQYNNTTPSFNTVETIHTDTDINDYIYPRVTIHVSSSGGDITISNNSDDPSRLTVFRSVPANATIIMNQELGMISGDYYKKFSSKNFIRFLDGDNRISIAGDINTIKFEWQNRRYL